MSRYSRNHVPRRFRMNDKLLGVLIWVFIMGIIFTFMYFMNNDSASSAAEFHAEQALEDIIFKEGEFEAWEIELTLKDTSVRGVDTDYGREVYNNVSSTKEVTLTYEFNNKEYKVFALVENINSDSYFSNWEFYKIVSVEHTTD